MDFRQLINKRPWISIVAVGAVVAGAVVLAVNATGNRIRIGSGPAQMYFSDDDGKTFFADDSARVPPFEHSGKTAYLAGVFRCPGHEPAVTYLIRYTPEVKTELENLSGSARNSSDPQVNALKSRGMQVKAPGATKWIPYGSDEFDLRVAGDCPAGVKGVPEQVFPGK